ncbi:hypothetical protein TRICHSKD4_5370 [Roseibium sp. TrichSKD4]|nr:hypothetical protein TRICHSKD4_5370 [Roseibium sp. TrichSKD4]
MPSAYLFQLRLLSTDKQKNDLSGGYRNSHFKKMLIADNTQ